MHDSLLKQRGTLGCWRSAGVSQCGLRDSQHRSSLAVPQPQAQLTLEEQGADAGGWSKATEPSRSPLAAVDAGTSARPG